MSKGIAYVGSTSSHGGLIVSSGGAGELYPNSTKVAVNGALHSCPRPGHGVTPVSATTTTVFHNGKAVIRKGDRAGCGAVITGVHENIPVGD